MTLPATTGIDPAPKPPDPRYGRIATRGMVWVAFQTMLAKGLSFVAQLVLGWLLAKDDYALYAVAISVASIVSTLRNGGLQKVLIQQGREYTLIASPVLQVSLAFNLACAALLAAGAPLFARFYEAPALPPLLYIMAAAIVLSTPAMVFQARVLSELQFGVSSRIISASAVVQYASMILFAAIGLGPLSFVLPLIAVALFEAFAFGAAAGWLPPWRSISRRLLRELLSASGWMMLSALAITLINQGDFLVVGRLRKEILADYFFGVMLAAAFAVLFGAGLHSVLMPTLSKLTHDAERFNRAYLHSIRTFVLLCAPLCVLTAAMSGPLVHALWQGKWDQSIPVVQIFTLSLLFRMTSPIALAAIEARAQWRLGALLLAIDAAGTLVAATIGCLAGGLLAVTISMCANRVAMALLQCMIVSRVNGESRRAVLLAMLPPLIICLAASAAGLGCGWLTQRAFGGATPWVSELAFCLVFAAAFIALCKTLVPLRFGEAIILARSMISR